MTKYAPFNQKTVKYFRNCIDPQNWLCVAEGGKRAGKNIINILAWCTVLETHPDFLHLAGGVSTSTAKLNIIQSNGFGVANYFAGRCHEGKYQDRDALYITTKVGEKVILIGGGANNGSEKLIKGFTLGSVYVSEANECSKTFIQECFDRTLSSNLRKIFFDLNPKNPQDYFYTDILDVQKGNSLEFKNYGYMWEHFTIADNNSISDEQLKTRLKSYRRGSVWWNRDIMGLRSAAEGIIYDGFSKDNIYEDDGPDWNLYYNRYYSIDYGTINPFACSEIIEQTIEGNTEYYIDNEYYYDSKKHNKQLSDAEYAVELEKFIDNKKYRAIIIDPSAASFKAELRKRSLKNRETADTINADNEVLNGIRLVATMLQAKKLHINKRCENLIREFSAYVWDEKASERGVEKPAKENDHCLTGDTLIDTIKGQIPIRNLVGKIGKVFCFDEINHKKTISNFKNVRCTKQKADVFEIKLEDGRIIHATEDHLILTQQGWIELKDISSNDYVLSIK